MLKFRIHLCITMQKCTSRYMQNVNPFTKFRGLQPENDPFSWFHEFPPPIVKIPLTPFFPHKWVRARIHALFGSGGKGSCGHNYDLLRGVSSRETLFPKLWFKILDSKASIIQSTEQCENKSNTSWCVHVWRPSLRPLSQRPPENVCKY